MGRHDGDPTHARYQQKPLDFVRIWWTHYKRTDNNEKGAIVQATGSYVLGEGMTRGGGFAPLDGRQTVENIDLMRLLQEIQGRVIRAEN